MGEKIKQFQNHEVMLCLTLSGDVYFFVPNNVQSSLFSEQLSFCLFVLVFYGPVNNEVMSSRSVNSGTVLWQA